MSNPSADGASALRREDPPLVTGAAVFTGDLAPPGALHAVFVRAPLASGRILGIDPAAAAAMDGVAGVFTAADLDLPPMPAGDAPDAMARPVLAAEVVRFLGEAVAVVVAATRAQVQDVEVAATRDGRITGLRARLVADGGAYPGEATSMPSSTRYMASGVYRIPRVEVAWTCAATNTTPVAAYRGAGRPEATALVERAVDLLAAR